MQVLQPPEEVKMKSTTDFNSPCSNGPEVYDYLVVSWSTSYTLSHKLTIVYKFCVIVMAINTLVWPYGQYNLQQKKTSLVVSPLRVI